jgi:hypothetical protein
MHLSIIIWRLNTGLLELDIDREPGKEKGELHGDLTQSAIDMLLRGVMVRE